MMNYNTRKKVKTMKKIFLQKPIDLGIINDAFSNIAISININVANGSDLHKKLHNTLLDEKKRIKDEIKRFVLKG